MPSTLLFADYCKHLTKAYSLDGVVETGMAVGVTREGHVNSRHRK
jgi:hypothetical protein